MPLIPLVHSFLTVSSISNFSEALWSNIGGYNEKLEQHVKKKNLTPFLAMGHQKKFKLDIVTLPILFRKKFKLLSVCPWLKMEWDFSFTCCYISHYNPQYFNQFDHNASEKLEIDECVKNEWTRGMSGLKINIWKSKFLYFTILLFK